MSQTTQHPHAICDLSAPGVPLHGPARLQAFSGLFECLVPSPENRGVPGSSPGLAIRNPAFQSDCLFCGTCRGSSNRALEWETKRGGPAHPARGRLLGLLETRTNTWFSGPARTEATTTSPSWCSRFDAAMSASAASRVGPANRRTSEQVVPLERVTPHPATRDEVLQVDQTNRREPAPECC
jgi:hypothetical protein